MDSSGKLEYFMIAGTWAEYGLICALHMARRSGTGPVTGRDVAARERLPADYVEQILLRMRRAGIVNSTRGARGGYALARAAEATEWDRYESLQWHAGEEWARENPSDPDRVELLRKVRENRNAFLRWGRDAVGDGLYLFRKP